MTSNGIRVAWRSMADLVLNILNDNALLSKLSIAAQNIAREKYSMATYRDNIKQLLVDVLRGNTTYNYKRSRLSEVAGSCLANTVFSYAGRSAGEVERIQFTLQYDNDSYNEYVLLVAPYSSIYSSQIIVIPNSIPYFINQYYINNQCIIFQDPIWPCTVPITSEEEKLCGLIDGKRSLLEISAIAIASGWDLDINRIIRKWLNYGLILLLHIEPLENDEDHSQQILLDWGSLTSVCDTNIIESVLLRSYGGIDMGQIPLRERTLVYSNSNMEVQHLLSGKLLYDWDNRCLHFINNKAWDLVFCEDKSDSTGDTHSISVLEWAAKCNIGVDTSLEVIDERRSL
jgi:hypothetical protein